MDDDLNFPRALSEFFSIIKKINILIKDHRISAENARVLLDEFKSVDAVMRIFNFSPKVLDPAVRELMETREAARIAGDFAKADRIREELRALGVKVRDDKI
jgi:cysteinyl-tRNA synthetase